MGVSSNESGMSAQVKAKAKAKAKANAQHHCSAAMRRQFPLRKYCPYAKRILPFDDADGEFAKRVGQGEAEQRSGGRRHERIGPAGVRASLGRPAHAAGRARRRQRRRPAWAQRFLRLYRTTV